MDQRTDKVHNENEMNYYLSSFLSFFLGEDMQLHKRLCPSVELLIHWSVGLSISTSPMLRKSIYSLLLNAKDVILSIYHILEVFL